MPYPIMFDGPQIYYVAVYSILAFSCVLSIIVIFSITHTYRVLRANKNIFSKRTYTLYRTLINALVIEMLLSGAMVMAPLVVTITCFLLDFDFTSIIAMLSLLIASLFPTVLHLLTLFYVAPYKRAIIRIYKGLRGMPVEAMTTYDLTKAPVVKHTKK
uniref:G protein-coupled receptor n=1 Tax=Acrobeloides nanus TaxID=290746 RepID=A0A914CAM5_9BILA